MFGKLLNYTVLGSKIIVEFENKKGIVTLISEEIINLKEENTAKFSIDLDSFYEFDFFDTEFKDGMLNITSGLYRYVIKDNFMMDVYKNGVLISSEDYVAPVVKQDNVNLELMALEGHRVDRGGNATHIVINKKINKDDYLYGLGEKTGFLNKRNYEYEMYNSDIPDPHVDSFKALYKSIPFYITFNPKYCYGFFFDNTYRQFFDMGKNDPEHVKISAHKGCFNYYFIGGDSLKDVVSNYSLVSGKMPLPQRFTLGHQQCRWSYMNKEELLFVANKYRELGIPCDVLFLDIDYMERYKVFTYSEERFADLPQVIDDLAKDGFKVVTIIDPGVKLEEGYFMYDEAIKNGYVATLNGQTYVNAVWPGDSVFPSFVDTKTREWWASHVKDLVDFGVRGIWNDMNEPASFKGPLPDNVEFNSDGETHYHDEVHNVYGHYMAEATYNGLVEHDKRRPYIITRAAYAGTQKYSTVWTGDNHSIWAHLQMGIPMLLNLGMSGFAFCGTDVGGFGSDCTPELLARWSQFGAFTPLFRNHSACGTRRQEPWTFNEETTNAYRNSVLFRYQLIPYLYDLFYESSETGLPVLRPLVMEFEHDQNTYEINDEVMLGSSILGAFVTEQGQTKKMIYLPGSYEWYDYHSKKVYQPGYHIVDAPLDKVLAFVKKGSIIPQSPVRQYIEEDDTLILDVYPGVGSYVHYQDNGEDFKNQDGEYNLYHIYHEDNLVRISLLYEGYKTYKKVILKYLGTEIEVEDYEQEIVIE